MDAAITTHDNRSCTTERPSEQPGLTRRAAVAIAWPLVAALLAACDVIGGLALRAERRLRRASRPFGY